MRVAFLYIAEAYQCYHAAAVALDLATRPGVEVVVYYNDPETSRHLERIRAAWAGPHLATHRLERSPLIRMLQAPKRLGMMKSLVMRKNARVLDRFDVIVSAEDTAAALRAVGVRNPVLVYLPHGAGDRARGFSGEVATFDLTLTAGEKTARRMLEMGLIKPGSYAMPGYVKLETAGKLLAAVQLPFARSRPIVLYNPHKARRLESWSHYIEPMLEAFEAQDQFNLIVAPHIKLFRRRSFAARRRWERRSSGKILIDLGSDRSVDMTYSSVAEIYVGDVSSLVYEFIARPRPCVFLNAHQINWHGNPDFRHWQLGDVVDEPARLMETILAAPSRHHLYQPDQEAFAMETLGDRSPGAAHRAASAILAFWDRKRMISPAD